MKGKFASALSLALIVAMLFTSVGLASDVNVAVVDVTAPTGSVTLSPGGSGAITINMSVTGKQDGTATFEVYRDWTLSGGTFVGSNPQQFTVPARPVANAPATTFSTSGTVTVAAGQANGTFMLVVSAFDIDNGNSTGAKLSDGADGHYSVTVYAPPPPANTAPSVTVTGVANGTDYEIGSVPAATCNVVDAEDGNKTFAATLSAVTGPLAAYGLGSQTASCSYTDGGGLTGSASVTYNIADTTKPIITFVSRTDPNSNDWNNGDVTVTWSCTDSGSGVVAATVSQTVITEDADQSATGTCADRAGNTASDTQTGINIDKTAPSITGSRSPDGNSYGWNKVDVDVTFTCDDELSGVSSCGPNATVSAEAAGQSVTGIATDLAGNTASTSVNNISIDKTAPIASATANPGPNANGWNNTDVVISFSGTDGLSGIDTCSESVTLSNEGANQSTSGTCTDKAGNESAAASASASIDKTAPTVALVGGPANGGVYYYGFVPAAPTCTASDALSGIDGDCSVSGYSNAIGIHTVKASVTDQAGNSASTSATYEVKAWTLKGFYQPVDMNGVLNTVKNGSTVPLKFEIFAGPTELTSIDAVKSFTVKQISCSTSAPIDDIELVTTGGTTLRYDMTGGQFIQNWQTPKGAGICYQVTMTTQDGSFLSALFKTK